MGDYMTYRPPTIQSYTHDSSNYAPSPPHHTQPLDSINRSMTRGSYYSHLTASNSTRSWVQQTMQHPPPPPEESMAEQSFSPPARTPRPLPQPGMRPISTLHTINADPEEDEERYMGEPYMGTNPSQGAATVRYGYTGFENGGGVADGGGNILPRRMMTASPPPLASVEMMGEPKGSTSFVGGFVRGLRQLPKKFGVGGKSSGEKLRKGTLRRTTEDSKTNASLPKYQSQPTTPIGGPRYTDPSDITPTPANYAPYNGANDVVPAELLSGVALRRVQPVFRVTPPSEESDPQLMQAAQPQYAQVVHPDTGFDANGQRTTVMMYADTNTGESDGGPIGRVPSRLNGTIASNRYSRVSTARAPSITIAPPPPVLQQQQHHQPPPTTTTGDMNPGQGYDGGASDMFSPATEHPLPTTDYLKMNRFTGSPSRSRATLFSRGTATSFYDPSFIEELSPVERFFKTLYHLPWVARGRVTVDYKPSEENGSKKGMKKAMGTWYRRMSRAGKDLDLLSNGTPEPLGMTPRTSANLTSMGSRRTVRQRRSRSSGDLHRYYQQGPHYRHRKPTRKRRHHRNTMSTLTEEETMRSASPILPSVYPYSYPPYPYTYPGYAAVPPNMPPGQGTALAPIPGSPNPMADGGPPGVVNLSAQQQAQVEAQLMLQSQQFQLQMNKRSPRGPRTKKSTRHLGGGGGQYAHAYAPYQPLAFPPGAPPPPPIYVVHGSPTLTPMTPAGMAMPQMNGSPHHHHQHSHHHHGGGGDQKVSPGSPQPQQQYYVPVQVLPGGWGTSQSSSAGSRSPTRSPTPRGVTS
ncbi:hypothetical protein BKA70DRAFT_683950 [Coprinopsis sp. MPI-PUGE-AT-0042]|nr:hypothetical protein BKA70DRAFT_683950 [Coprinopsis sp. MPI-PUGE-AT-0042]